MQSRNSGLVGGAAAIALGLLTVAGPVNVARADGGGDPGWLKETTDKGCYRMVGDLVDSNSSQGQGFVWTGPCTPGQPITGDGTFYRQYPDGFIVAYTGRIVDGFPDGPIRSAFHQMSGGTLGPAQREEVLNYRMGCPETLGSACQPGSPTNVVNIAQVSPAHFPLPGGPSSFAGTPATPASPAAPRSTASMDDDCVTMERDPGGSGWGVVNRCSYKAIGSWCYENDDIFSCAKHKAGGFGPLGPGKREAVSMSPGAGVRFRIVWCDYDEWTAGECQANNPWDLQR